MSKRILVVERCSDILLRLVVVCSGAEHIGLTACGFSPAAKPPIR